jgi:predicted nucleotidyltransferase
MAIETITRGVIGRSRLTDKAKIIIDGIRAKYITREKKILLVSKKAENEDVS